MHRSAAPAGPFAAAIAAAVLSAACTGATTSPSSETAGPRLDGLVVSAIDGAASAGLQVQIAAARPTTTDAAGHFSAAVAAAETYPAVVKGDTIVERRTTVSALGGEPARLSVIPASFDLRAFDEMFRATGRLQRWTTRPSLVILGSVMSYRGPADAYAATSEQMTADEASRMASDLTDALSLLTGGTYSFFDTITVERPASGERASVVRDGAIVVGRYNGILTIDSTIGYGRWAEQADGSIAAGAMFLDRTFDRDDERRRLLRFHELGHALGYLHVESRTSIMNPAIGPEPTAFDRAGAAIAFNRPAGNLSPDTDPGFSGPTPGFGGGLRWMKPVACRVLLR